MGDLEELFQRTGSFKPHGALSVMLALDAGTLARGVTGVSTVNNAIVLGFSARKLGTTAKVVMPKSANPCRVQVFPDPGVAIEAAVSVVEPEGVDSLSRSFEAGSPQAIDAVRTIADSLCVPRYETYSYALDRRFVDEVVLVSDDQIREVMRLLFRARRSPWSSRRVRLRSLR